MDICHEIWSSILAKLYDNELYTHSIWVGSVIQDILSIFKNISWSFRVTGLPRKPASKKKRLVVGNSKGRESPVSEVC